MRNNLLSFLTGAIFVILIFQNAPKGSSYADYSCGYDGSYDTGYDYGSDGRNI